MAVYTKQSFKAELETIWNSAVIRHKPSWYGVGSQEVEIDDAWLMYEHARKSTLQELLLGDTKLRSHMEILKNFGTTSGTKTTMEQGSLFEEGLRRNKITAGHVQESLSTVPVPLRTGDKQHIRFGSVLNDGWWWPFKNDAWILGGIHGLRRFHLAMSDVPDDLIWDKANGRPRMLGRELIGLKTAGYSLIGVPAWAVKTVTEGKDGPTTVSTPVSPSAVREAIGHVFAPTAKSKAEAMTFTKYYGALDVISSINNIKKKFLQVEVAFDSYDFNDIKTK
ncbi:hypothetical protein JFU49_04990 [Pseudomonas sp. TH03]|uniref:hypothetical protein n=1 Tax=Pseudomonas sp. TH03 TaxID=2796369 RepID=UPI001911C7A7|nr:hypothetical protein [Pseudomonas sp. TH03]MBK5549643.1 hypothetical protein [Pseudomonas sp. TH03]